MSKPRFAQQHVWHLHNLELTGITTMIWPRHFRAICQLDKLLSLVIEGDADDGYLEQVTPEVSWLTQLESLRVHFSYSDETGPEIPLSDRLSCMECLTNIELSGVAAPFSVLSRMCELESLTLANRWYDMPESLGALATLTCLQLYNTGLLDHLTVLGTLSNLMSLEAEVLELDAYHVHDFSRAIRGLHCLTRLELQELTFTFDLGCLSGLSQLRRLAIGAARVRHPFPVLNSLVSLRSLDLAVSGMCRMLSTAALSGLTSLSYLRIASLDSSFQLVEPLSTLCSALPCLQVLDMHQSEVRVDHWWSHQSKGFLSTVDALADRTGDVFRMRQWAPIVHGDDSDWSD